MGGISKSCTPIKLEDKSSFFFFYLLYKFLVVSP
ncbi:hypothetical protein RDI58_024312 [Solanum bulbocastanum]|uniref:Uncharacterized protein n=1 Tax=Solanum bulbocastanum TaxID=147425 RepID=A0AAN8Y373_SOLBU